VRVSSAGAGPAVRAERMGVIGGSGRGSAIAAIIAEVRGRGRRVDRE
jgi:hypothetical protein